MSLSDFFTTPPPDVAVAIDHAHQMWILGAAAAGLVWGNENLGATEGGQAHVLNDVAIVTNQHSDAKPLRNIENGVI